MIFELIFSPRIVYISTFRVERPMTVPGCKVKSPVVGFGYTVQCVVALPGRGKTDKKGEKYGI
jgi:hypothetical protein